MDGWMDGEFSAIPGKASRCPQNPAHRKGSSTVRVCWMSILIPVNQQSQNSRLFLAGKDLEDNLAHGRDTFQRPEGSKSHFSSPSSTLPALAHHLGETLAADKEEKIHNSLVSEGLQGLCQQPGEVPLSRLKWS